jgi:GNAT superfamily N-acetyltransferase
MTQEEFLNFRNPQDKHHPSDSYQTDLKGLNIYLSNLGNIDRKVHIWKVLGEPDTAGLLITKGDDEDNVVGVLHHGTLYHDPRWRPEPSFGYMDPRMQWQRLQVDRVKPVKYVTEYVGLVSRVAERNLQHYPHTIQHINVKGEPLQVRSEKPPVTDAGENIVILNSKGEIVAMASDEWGATLFRVVKEYRGKGLGQVIGRFWYDANPSFGSGGFTPAGEKNAVRLWEERVREFLARGWYTELIRQGKLTRDRVDAILQDLDGHRQAPDLPEDGDRPKSSEKDLRFLIEPGQYFIVYDARALDGNENDYPDEQYIHAYGFFRSSENIGWYLFRIDYDRPFQKLATTIALQMARDEGEPLYVGEGYTDIVEWQNIPGVEKDGDYITLTQDVLPITMMARVERLKRKPVDRYGQRHNLLIEAAEMKWR